MATKMRDLIIVLPGIMGSALQKNGKDIWALSGQAIWQHFSGLGDSVHQLRIAQDDWRDDDLGDGIRAVQLIEDLHSIPFLVEHAGYSVIIRRIKEYFDVKEGFIDEPHDDENFFTFPNGLLFRSLTDLVRSFRSAYQIVPTYPAVEVDGRYVRVSETNTIPIQS